jgi:membrane protein YdbS with pleckstrin-like domain
MAGEIFQNSQVDMTSLPSAEDIVWMPLEPGYKRMLLLLAIFQFAVLITILSVILPFVDLPGWAATVALIVVVLGSLLQVVAIVKGFPYKGYALRMHDMLYRTGWLYKKQVAVPLNRIQHVDIRQGLFERTFGLSRLNIYTAGGESSDITIPGLREPVAQQLKTYILKETGMQDEEE